MNSNAFFTIGKIHTVCEDYARAGDLNGYAYAILSDGCSSSKDTDIGARLLVANATRLMHRKIFSIKEIGETAAGHARDSLGFPDIESTCLDATLFIATENPDKSVTAAAFGDGFIIARSREKVIESYRIDFDNIPAYPSYLLSNSRQRTYVEQGCSNRLISLQLIVEGLIVKETFTNSEIFINSKGEITPKFLDWAYFSVDFQKDKYDLVLLASDGIDSFTDKDGHPVPVGQIIKELTDIKTFNGEFIVRRMKTFLHKFCTANGWQHYDDVSVAAIYLG